MLVPHPPKNMPLIKSKKRVVDHGEVFTPPWMVEAMLDLVKEETRSVCRLLCSPRESGALN